VTQSGQHPAAPQPAPSDQPGTGVSKEEQSGEPAAPPKGWPLWVWPPVAIALIAIAGYWLGIAGAVIAAASAVAALVFVGGDFLYSGQRRRALAILAVSVGVTLLAGLLWQGKVPWTRLRMAGQNPMPGPVSLRGVTITQEQVNKLNLRGAELAGSTLDGLDLHAKQMEGATAPGASFRHVDLSFASLRGADLNGIDLSYSCLIGTDFSGALMNGANVNHAVLRIQSLSRSTIRKLMGVPISPRAHQTKCPHH